MGGEALFERRSLELLAETAGYDATRLAHLCAVSVRKQQRFFQRSMGCSPQKWLNDLRIFRAQEQLLTNKSVKHIALEMGYSDASYFCNQFRRVCGVTPTEFRVEKLGESGR